MRWRWAWIVALPVAGCNAPFPSGDYNPFRRESYALDSVDRAARVDGGLPCYPEGLVLYRGGKVKLQPPSSVAEPFKARLERFESLLIDLGERTYGRGPSQILHAGTYACRAVGHRPQNLSEHALGNAIDVTGFRFPPLPRGGRDAGVPTAHVELPKKLGAGFVISVAKDFTASAKPSDTAKVHERFFRLLTDALREQDIFRGAIGPADPNHETHLHLDMAPWPYQRL